MLDFSRFIWAALKRKPIRPILAAVLLLLGLNIESLLSKAESPYLSALKGPWTGWVFVLLAAGLLAFSLYRHGQAISSASSPGDVGDPTSVSALWAGNRVDELFAVLRDARASQRGTAPSQAIEEIARALSKRSVELDDGRPLEVSIIVAASGDIAATILCLRSVLEHATRHRFEVIVADDRPTDGIDTIERIGSIVRRPPPAQDRDRRSSWEEAAKTARGKYLVFLSGETFVLDGWLDELISPFERVANAGLVGSKLLRSDGKLLEAGGIVWKDGSTLNYGCDEDPELPEFNYLKDVDFCSRCSLALPRDIWQRAKGLGEGLAAAYADVDLAFSIRALGHRTIFNPRSMLIRHEPPGYRGANIATGQGRDREKFAEKWRRALDSEHYPRGENLLLARDRSRGRPHILVVDHHIPKIDRDAGSRSMFDYLKLFVAQGVQVAFWPHDLRYEPLYTHAIQALGVEVIYGSEHVGRFSTWLKRRGPLFSYAFLSRPFVAEHYIDDLRQFPIVKILFYGHDIHFLRMRRELQYSPSAALREAAEETEALERNIWSKVDVIYYPADFEVEFVAKEHPDKVSRVLPLYVFARETIDDARKRAETRTPGNPPIAIFCGGFAHSPNIDSAAWLAREIWPKIAERFPDAVLYLVGSSPTPEVRALESGNIRVTGHVSESALQAIYERASVALVPLRFGGGVKGKVLEAMRFGVPVVTTSTGVQGIPANASFVSVANDASGLANAAIRLLADPREAKAQAEAAVRFLAEHYSRRRAEELLALDIVKFRVEPANRPES